ncbi:agmatinase [Corallococcus exercitus]|uniref:agmatinase n=1 Tax=Corallococcus exercitus TaxID=2316736 RepID=UPI000EA27F36|nr:agmatinase [Corallococcus exercitus]RKG67199.1 agmatinase [Corallococcus exercitus]
MQQTLGEYLRHGQIPFLRLPLADFTRGDAVYDGASAVFIGVTYDGGTTYQPGARFAPYHVRRASASVELGRLSDEAPALKRALDGGNVPLPLLHAEGMRAAVEAEVTRIVSSGAAPFVVGGDHSVTLPVLRAVARKHGPIALVHVDAHSDMAEGGMLGEERHHGTTMRHALTEGLIARGQLHQIGIRHSGDPDLIREHASNEYRIDDVEDRGIAAILAEVRERVGQHPVYLTFDIDAVDPAFAPGTGTPVPGGLTSREALRLVRSLAGCRLVGMDVVEVLPSLDHAEVTSLLAAQLLLEAVALLP